MRFKVRCFVLAQREPLTPPERSDFGRCTHAISLLFVVLQRSGFVDSYDLAGSGIPVNEVAHVVPLSLSPLRGGGGRVPSGDSLERVSLRDPPP